MGIKDIYWIFASASRKVSSLHILHRINKSFTNTNITHANKQTNKQKSMAIPFNIIYFVHNLFSLVCMCDDAIAFEQCESKYFVNTKEVFSSLKSRRQSVQRKQPNKCVCCAVLAHIKISSIINIVKVATRFQSLERVYVEHEIKSNMHSVCARVRMSIAVCGM